MEFNSTKIILGSQSPRRRALLLDAGFLLEFTTPDIEEVFPDTMDYYEVPEFLSVQKISAVYNSIGHDKDFILCADTVVIFEGKLLGKPDDLQHAFEILKVLNGKSHDVVTGVTIRKNNRQISFSEHAKVNFKSLTDEEILHYVHTCNPLDKAGAYNIQEYPGFDQVVGEFQNVMGLPINRVIQEIVNWDLH